jgi:rare lipoprotein A
LRLRFLAIVAVLMATQHACSRPTQRTAKVAEPDHASDQSRAPRRVQHGRASYYSDKFHGRRTASGERFNQHKLTAAHRSLPFGTMVRVTNHRNGKSVVVKINDRGPWGNRGGIIDLSRAAAKQIDMIRAGRVPVTVEILRDPEP